MEAKDLMIGDWVKFPNGNDKVVDLPYIEGRGICASFAASATLFPVEVDKIEPIPLTPEILEQNGFEFGYTASEEDFCGATGCGYPEDKGWCYDEGAGEIKIIFPNDADGGLIRLDDQNGDRHLELLFVEPVMVHELQHALRLCGIDKEIIL